VCDVGFFHVYITTMFMHRLSTFGWCQHPVEVDQSSRFRGSKFCWILLDCRL